MNRAKRPAQPDPQVVHGEDGCVALAPALSGVL